MAPQPSTLVRDSIVGDDWIRQTAAAVPIQRVMDKETGQFTGDVLTGPVRLAFTNLFELPPQNEKNQNPKYGAACLFTPLADFTILYEEYYRICAEQFAKHYDAASGQYMGLHSPFRNQAEKLNFGGFTSGCTFISATSKYKPPVVDARGNAIVDKSKVYPGVWAICSINAYGFHDVRKKGVSFGLQSVMIIGDDTQHGGGPKDPTQTFAKVQGISAPIVRPDIGASMPQGASPNPPAPPHAPGVPQQRWTPPAGSPPVPPVPAAPPSDDDMSWNS